jgi:hypothetical protein
MRKMISERKMLAVVMKMIELVEEEEIRVRKRNHLSSLMILIYLLQKIT